MDKLMEHTLQRQLAAQSAKVDALQAQIAAQSAQVTELTMLLKGQLSLAGDPQPACPMRSSQVITGLINATTNTNTMTVNQLNQVNTIIVKPLVPWDGERRISITAQQIAAAFEENVRLKEYVRLEEHQLTDPVIAPPFVAELLMDLTKRAHADPTARNVYLNPKRSDQVLVHMASGKWEVMLLEEATRLIFDGVAKAMVRVTMSSEERRQLPLEAQNALAMAGLLYDDEPEEYAKKAKSPMAAHLANTMPRICQ